MARGIFTGRPADCGVISRDAARVQRVKAGFPAAESAGERDVQLRIGSLVATIDGVFPFSNRIYDGRARKSEIAGRRNNRGGKGRGEKAEEGRDARERTEDRT